MHEKARSPTCLTLLRIYSIYLGNRQERSLIKSSFSLFWQKENFRLPFAVNVMLNLSIIARMSLRWGIHQPTQLIDLEMRVLLVNSLFLFG